MKYLFRLFWLWLGTSSLAFAIHHPDTGPIFYLSCACAISCAASLATEINAEKREDKARGGER